MPNTFVKVGAQYINMSLVINVEIGFDQADPTLYRTATVHYLSGKSKTFTEGAEVMALLGWFLPKKGA